MRLDGIAGRSRIVDAAGRGHASRGVGHGTAAGTRRRALCDNGWRPRSGVKRCRASGFTRQRRSRLRAGWLRAGWLRITARAGGLACTPAALDACGAAQNGQITHGGQSNKAARLGPQPRRPRQAPPGGSMPLSEPTPLKRLLRAGAAAARAGGTGVIVKAATQPRCSAMR